MALTSGDRKLITSRIGAIVTWNGKRAIVTGHEDEDLVYVAVTGTSGDNLVPVAVDDLVLIKP